MGNAAVAKCIPPLSQASKQIGVSHATGLCNLLCHALHSLIALLHGLHHLHLMTPSMVLHHQLLLRWDTSDRLHLFRPPEVHCLISWGDWKHRWSIKASRRHRLTQKWMAPWAAYVSSWTWTAGAWLYVPTAGLYWSGVDPTSIISV